MRKRLGILATAAVSALAIVTWVTSASLAGPGTTTVHVIEHAVTDTVIDTGASGDTTGDLLTFHNSVFDAADKKVVGRDQGQCIRIDPAAGSWECIWTTFLPGGQITVEGPFYDTKNSTLAITGGTVHYQGARGSMRLVSKMGGKEFDFIFRILS